MKVAFRSMTMPYTRYQLAVAGLLSLLITTASQAQTWDSFQDPISGNICDTVNGSNADFVVDLATGSLILVSANSQNVADVLLADTFVDANNNVFFGSTPFGFIDFRIDAQGQRSLFWVSFTGEVIGVNGITLIPFVSNLFPNNFTNALCNDGCSLVNNPSVCQPTNPGGGGIPISINICGAGGSLTLGGMLVGLAGMSAFRSRKPVSRI